MLKTGITHVTLPAKPGVRNAAQRIELGEKFSDELPNAPADTAGLQRSWPSASIETGAEEDQRVVINHCICCNKDMGSDSDHLVCEACGGGF